jgi:predicted alpha/beta hydrolase
METQNGKIIEMDVLTDDDWHLKTYHHPCTDSKNLPVIIFHALSLSAYSLNGNDGIPSIANWLSQNGYDVWVCECRGVGKSYHKDFKTKREWTFDDQLKYDVPAFINFIKNFTKVEKLHWIGHSMGGHLLLAYLSITENAPIQSGIIAGAGFEIPDCDKKPDLVLQLLQLFKMKRLPLRPVARISIPFLWLIPDQQSLFSKKITGYSVSKAIMRDVHSIPVTLFKYALDCFRKGGLRSTDQQLIYSSRSKDITTPLLFISADKDVAWTPSVITENLKLFSNGNAEMLALGKKYGHSEHYGHVDILMGKNAEKEVYPEILKWLITKKKSNCKNDMTGW